MRYRILPCPRPDGRARPRCVVGHGRTLHRAAARLRGVRAHLNRAGGTARPASRRLPQPTAPQPAAPDATRAGRHPRRTPPAPDATRAGRHPRRAARVCRVPPRRAVPDHPSRPVTVHSSTALRSEGHPGARPLPAGRLRGSGRPRGRLGAACAGPRGTAASAAVGREGLHPHPRHGALRRTPPGRAACSCEPPRCPTSPLPPVRMPATAAPPPDRWPTSG